MVNVTYAYHCEEVNGGSKPTPEQEAQSKSDYDDTSAWPVRQSHYCYYYYKTHSRTACPESSKTVDSIAMRNTLIDVTRPHKSIEIWLKVQYRYRWGKPFLSFFFFACSLCALSIVYFFSHYELEITTLYMWLWRYNIITKVPRRFSNIRRVRRVHYFARAVFCDHIAHVLRTPKNIIIIIVWPAVIKILYCCCVRQNSYRKTVMHTFPTGRSPLWKIISFLAVFQYFTSTVCRS